MRVNSQTIFFAFVAALIVAAVFYVLGGSAPETETAPTTVAANEPAEAKQESERFTPTTTREPGRRTQTVAEAPKGPKMPIDPSAAPNDTRPMAVKYSEFYKKPDWEQEIITLSERLDLDDDHKAVALLNKVFTLADEPAKVVALEHAAKHMSDEQFKRSKGQIYSLNDIGSGDMQEAILRDILTRAENVRMPALVDLLKRPPFPGQEEVREILEAYLDVDYGMDVPKWEKAVREWLIENDELE